MSDTDVVLLCPACKAWQLEHPADTPPDVVDAIGIDHAIDECPPLLAAIVGALTTPTTGVPAP